MSIEADTMDEARPGSDQGEPSSTSARPSLRVDSRTYHPCVGCAVTIPGSRLLCYFCSRTNQIEATTFKGIRCPMCPGNLNEPNHFTSREHVVATQPYLDAIT